MINKLIEILTKTTRIKVHGIRVVIPTDGQRLIRIVGLLSLSNYQIDLLMKYLASEGFVPGIRESTYELRSCRF